MSAPNLLLIMADQLAARFLPTYGEPTVIAPNLDTLAAGGVVFEQAYTASPLCAPARFSLLTGRLPSRIGAYDNAAELPAAEPTFVHRLRADGYQTCLVGKMHFVGPDQLHGYEERLTTDIYPADFGWTPDWDRPEARIDWWYHNMDSVEHAGPADASNQLDYDDEVGHRALRKLRDLARTADTRPWFLTVSFTHPHDPYVARHEYWDRYEGRTIPLPTVPPLSDDALDPHSRRLRRVVDAGRFDQTEERVRRARRAYFANITYLDEWVGRLRSVLDHHRLADDTIVVFTADHGDLLGERGLWYKMSFFENSLRVPLIVWAPTRFEAGRLAEPVSLLDVGPTLVDLAAGDPAHHPRPLDGVSLVPALSGDRAAGADRTIAAEYFGEGAIAPMFCLRRGRYKYVACPADPPQLFDLAVDPDEASNLAADPGRAEVVAGFAAEVAARWDAAAIDAEVRASQASRRLIDRAVRQGRYHSWDFQPRDAAAEQYMRNHLDLNEVERSRRA